MRKVNRGRVRTVQSKHLFRWLKSWSPVLKEPPSADLHALIIPSMTFVVILQNAFDLYDLASKAKTTYPDPTGLTHRVRLFLPMSSHAWVTNSHWFLHILSTEQCVCVWHIISCLFSTGGSSPHMSLLPTKLLMRLGVHSSGQISLKYLLWWPLFPLGPRFNFNNLASHCIGFELSRAPFPTLSLLRLWTFQLIWLILALLRATALFRPLLNLDALGCNRAWSYVTCFDGSILRV